MDPAYSKLPMELWITILKLAASHSCEDYSFFPPADDFNLLSGFAETSEEFKALTKVAAEAWPLSVRLKCADELAALQGSFGAIKHLLIESGLKTSTEVESLLIQLFDCKNISSLSLRFIGKANWHLFVVASRISAMKNNLRRLDVCYVDSQNWGSLSLDFPNLVELRLTKWDSKTSLRNIGLPEQYNGQDWINFGDRWKFLSCTLARTLRNLLKLELLSVHVTLERHDRLLDIQMGHRLRHDHLVRSYWDCSECIDAYSVSATILAENSSTKVLARTLPSLRSVSWTDLFSRQWGDERGQRTICIRRADDHEIILERDDGGHGDVEDIEDENQWLLHGVEEALYERIETMHET